MSSSHQSYVNAAASQTSAHQANFAGQWKTKEALGFKGDRFMIRLSISKSTVQDQPTFSALVEPICECTIWADDAGLVTRAEGAVSN
jgi:hypothetical protein